MSHTKVFSFTTASQFNYWLAFLCVSAILFAAPLIRGGNRQAALALLLPLGLVALAGLVANISARWHAVGPLHTDSPHDRTLQARPFWWWFLVLGLALSPIWISAIQLIPLNSDFWAGLAGREPYLQALQMAGVNLPSDLALTLHPAATKAALWSTIPAIAVFLFALFSDQKTTEHIFKVLLVAAMVQVAISLMQLIQGPKSAFFFQSIYNQGIIGSFNNRNHLADFFAMTLPIWFYLLIKQPSRRPNNRRHARKASSIDARLPLWLFLGFGLLVMVLMTRSRGGLIASTIVLLCCVVLLLIDAGKSLSIKQKLAIIVSFLVFGSLSLLSVELDGLSKRLESTQLQSDAELRNAYALATLEAARTFWPWGSGLGSFEAVFPRFQPMHTPGYVNHAHNDYAQLLMEAGLGSVLIAAIFVGLVCIQIASLIKAMRQRRGKRLPSGIMLRAYAGLGVLALLLHSWVEFNMRIPALAICAAFLFGTFLRPISKNSSPDAH